MRTVVGRQADLVGAVLHFRARDDAVGADRQVDGRAALRVEVVAERGEDVGREVIAARARVGVARLRVPVVGEALLGGELEAR